MEKLELTTIKNIADDFVVELKNKLTANGSDASGNLAKSIKGVVEEYGGKYIVITISAENYWKYIEYGTPPHYPPISVIKKWISVKPALPRQMKNGKLPTPQQLPYVIQTIIGKYGTKPKPFLKPTLTNFDLVGKVYDETVRLIKKQITEELYELE